MTPQVSEKRTQAFAVRVLRFAQTLPFRRSMQVLEMQLVRAATSIGANYREANRAESRKDFLHKVAVVEKEASETLYWLELIEALQIGDPEERTALLQECRELLAIFTRIGKTVRSRLSK
ncbi:hypothetical protein HRbin11_01577 [bacterium HR11]|nr:hypothetical protein HRbin11_01577 [bacterium HR11]